ncbi:MAG: AzlC family ABC transporter permease [Firmicutes bacterium]|nr:AzlC family ABC transporter permease [Bacillota bacterium]
MIEDRQMLSESFRWDDFTLALRQALPLTVSIFGYGLVFGVLARQSGLTTWEVLLMSTAVIAGSSQFVAVGMISAGAAAGQIVLATLLLNMRHLLMGASLAPYLRGVRTWKLAALAHLLNDESYALIIDRFQKHGGSVAYFLGAGLGTVSGWILSSALAGALGNLAGSTQKFGLDFAFAGTFIGLLVPQIKNRETWISFGVAAIVSLASVQLIPGKWYMVIAAVAAAVAGVVVESLASGSRASHTGHGPGHLSDEG